jgi:hypothetical protein
MADVKAIGDRALWLRHGEAVAIGETETVARQYLAAMTESAPQAAPAGPVNTIPNTDHRHGDGGAEISGFAVRNEFGEPLHLMTPNSAIEIRVVFRALRSLQRPDCGFLLRNHLGLDFSLTSARREGYPLNALEPGEQLTVDFQLNIPELYPGSFSFSPWIEDGDTVCDWIDNALTVQMARGEGAVYGYVHWPCRIELHSQAADIV